MKLSENHINSIKELLNIVRHIEPDSQGGLISELDFEHFPGDLHIEYDWSEDGFETCDGEPLADEVHLKIVTPSDELLETSLIDTTPSGAESLVYAVFNIIDKERSALNEKIARLESQLKHERSEREAAQRTIARLGGGER